MQDKLTTVLQYEIVKSFDMMNEISSGTFSNKLISLDPLTRTKRTTTFNYSNYLNSSDSLNPNPASPQLKNRFGKTQGQSYESVVKMAVGNANQNDVEYIKENDGVKRDIFIENFVPNRTAQLALANYTVLKLVIPGDSGITVGRTINFDLNTLKPKDTKDLDKFYSGKYLVSAVRHVVISPNHYQTILEITRDSSSTPYVTRDIDVPETVPFNKSNFLNTLFK
jgi:hypothetical protein